jgi:hypothetical protein
VCLGMGPLWDEADLAVGMERDGGPGMAHNVYTSWGSP